MNKIKNLEKQLNKLWKKRASEKWGNEKCEACGDPFSTFHHWIPKSRSTLLRYDIENAIPICQKCHYKIHNSCKPTEIQKICNIIEKKRGKKWLKYIKDREHISIRKNIIWLNEQKEKLEKI